MNEQIGENSGRVWKHLTEQPSATPKQLSKALNLKESEVYMAIGWLAREGKLAFDADGKTIKVGLATQAAHS